MSNDVNAGVGVSPNEDVVRSMPEVRARLDEHLAAMKEANYHKFVSETTGAIIIQDIANGVYHDDDHAPFYIDIIDRVEGLADELKKRGHL